MGDIVFVLTTMVDEGMTSADAVVASMSDKSNTPETQETAIKKV